MQVITENIVYVWLFPAVIFIAIPLLMLAGWQVVLFLKWAVSGTESFNPDSEQALLTNEV